MNMNEIRQRGLSIARDSVRQENLVSTGGVLELLPDALESMSMDKEYLLRRIEDELRKPTMNPLNAVLGIFGMRIIHTENTLSTLGGELEGESGLRVTEESAGEASQFLRLNEETLAGAAKEMAERLGAAERSAKETEIYLKEQNAALHAEAERGNEALSQLRADYQDALKSVAERVQYILSLQGPDGADAVTKQLGELLTDLNMEAVWHGELPDESAAEGLFTVFRTTGTERRREKPCVLLDGKPLLKGVRFETDEPAGT